MELQICRICVSVNIKMFTLKNTNIENFYKLLTQVYVDTEDGKPTTVCFLCYARLQQCNRLQLQAIKSNKLLEQLLKGGFMQATANAILNNQYTSQDLKVSSTYHLDLEPANCKYIMLDTKVEANKLISVKEEELTINEYFSEDASDPNNLAPEGIHSDSDDQLLIEIGSNKCNGIKDIAHGMKLRKQEEEDNLCIIQPEKEVKIALNPKDKTSNSYEEANDIYVKSERDLYKKKSTFVRNKQKIQKPINNDVGAGVDMKCERKEETETIVVSNKQKNQKPGHNEDTQKESPEKSIINIITGEFKRSECSKRLSTKNKVFSCNSCEYKFAYKTALTRHIRRHKGEKTFCCNICGFKFFQKIDLKRHISSHTGEKPFSCNICGFRCAHRQNLQRHIRTHTGEKPFSCNICEYRCAYNHVLKAHMRSHTGEKRYSCNICEYRCTKSSYLKSHLRTHN